MSIKKLTKSWDKRKVDLLAIEKPKSENFKRAIKIMESKQDLIHERAKNFEKNGSDACLSQKEWDEIVKTHKDKRLKDKKC